MAAIISRTDFDVDYFLASNPDIADAPANWFAGVTNTSIGGTVKNHPDRAAITYGVYLQHPERPARATPSAPVSTSGGGSTSTGGSTTSGGGTTTTGGGSSTTTTGGGTTTPAPAPAGGIGSLIQLAMSPGPLGLPWAAWAAGAYFLLKDK